MQLKILEIIDRAPQVRSIRFERPEGFEFRPGQFVLVLLKIDGKLEKRAYSISSSPTEHGHIEITFKSVDGGAFSPALFKQEKGTTIEVKGPYGLFTLDESHMENLVLIAGGTGISPIRSILKYMIDTGKQVPTSIIYGARTPQELIYHDEFQAIHQRYPLIGIYFTVDNDGGTPWPWHRGHIDKEFIKECVHDLHGAHYYVVGPPKMIQNLLHYLEELGVPTNHIHTERW